MRDWFNVIFGSMRRALQVLRSTDPLILASSTAFFATFALSPILIILVNLFSLYPTSFRFSHQLFKTISATLGQETSHDIEVIVNNFQKLEGNLWITIGGTIFLFFVATTMLVVVKHGINKIWHIRPKPEVRFKYHSRERGLGIGFLVITAFLFLINFIIDSMMAVSMDYLTVTWPKLFIDVILVFHRLFGIIVVTLWFTMLLKWLPDARLSWDVALSGGLLTGLLFSAGKLLLARLLVHSRVESIFGASASIALLLLFIFYVSFMLYYGAAFTYAYAQSMEDPICAGKYADEYEEKVIERDAVSGT
jgi:membrane protein